MPKHSTFDFGEAIESERLLHALLTEDINSWMDYDALDNALYFNLAEFNMNGEHYVIHDTRRGNSIWIQKENSFVPCGWFKLK